MSNLNRFTSTNVVSVLLLLQIEHHLVLALLSLLVVLALLSPFPVSEFPRPLCDRVGSTVMIYRQPRCCVVTKYEPLADHDELLQFIDPTQIDPILEPTQINPILAISRQRRILGAFSIAADPIDRGFNDQEMTVGVLYETSMMQDTQHEWMTGRLPRSAHEKQM